MPRVLGVQVDDELSVLVDEDIRQLSAAAGVEMTVSQYLRMVLAERFAANRLGQLGRGGLDVEGWGEGYRAAYAEGQRKLAEAFHKLTGREDE